MIFTIALAASLSNQAVQQQETVWHSCVVRTAGDWSSEKAPDDIIVESAFVHCRDELNLALNLQADAYKSQGISASVSEKLVSMKAAFLMKIVRGFALDALQRGRRKG